MTTKADIVASVAQDGGLTKAQAGDAVRALVTAVRESLADGKRVQIAGLGIFKRVDRAARKARNPRTGDVVHVPPRRDVTFKPAVDLLGRI